MRIILVSAVAAMLAACQPAQAPAEAAEAVQVVQTPEAFVGALYTEGYVIDADGPLWSAAVRALLEETERLTVEGDMGFFEADPICDCQDGTPVLQSATATSTGPDRADVAVVQTFEDIDGVTHHKTYNLVQEGGAWRIDDIYYQDMASEFPYPPFREQLTRWIADAKTHPAE